jgi:DNA-binding MarR family transcriptional regulator
MLAELYHLSPGHLARRLQQVAVAHFQEAMGEDGITPIQFAMLVAIAEFPGRDIQRLAELAALDRSNAGTVIGRLAREGLVERIAGDHDRRGAYFAVTDAGSSALDGISAKVELAQQAILQPLRASARRSFCRRLSILVDQNDIHSRARSQTLATSSSELSISKAPGHLIRRLRQICDGIFTQEASDFDITPVQYAALITLRRYDGADNVRLASLVALDPATLGVVVRRLHAKGFLTIDRNSQDRRSKSLHVTSAGHELLSEMRTAIARVEDRILAPLSPEGGRQFVAQMIEIVRAAKG